MNDFAELKQPIANLLIKAGRSSPIVSIENCLKGGNNRTYRVKTHDGYYAVKQYFRQKDDTRDRLANEFAFLSYAAKVTYNSVPKPYCQDADHALALYEYIEGKALTADEIT